jgi:molybdopterin biosynthesis enzyme
VRAADIGRGHSCRAEDLHCIGKLFTGQVSTNTVGPGQCIEKSRPRSTPDGADAVVIVEDTSSDLPM